MLSRPVRLAAQGVALVGVVAGTVAFTSFDKAVGLTVDGRTSAVHAFGSTVGDVLDSEGIAVGEHDLVSPALDAKVSDGSDVVVRYGRKLTVTTDGTAKDYWTTARTVDEALNQMGLRADSARLSVSRSLPLGRQGLQVAAATKKSVRVVDGGKAATRTTYATTVAQLLDETSVGVGALDRLSVPSTSRLRDGAQVTITRVVRKQVSAAAPVPFTSTTVRTADLTKGTTRTRTAGAPGAARLVFVETWVDGKRTARQQTSRTVVRTPVTEVVLVGTKPKPKPRPAPVAASSSRSSSSTSSTSSAAIPRSGGLNWAALARCESGGNPRAVNPNGHYGLYQFSLQTWRGVGGSGNPVDASVAEQSRRAQILYDRSGAGQWSCGSHLFD